MRWDEPIVLCGLLAAAAPSVALAQDGGAPVCARPAAVSLKHLICDVKRSLAGAETRVIDESNYEAILKGMKEKLGCTGIRLYIDPAISDPGAYPPLYLKVLDYARKDLALEIYASPLGTGKFGKDDDAFARWVADYANRFQPEFLSPFNESGYAPAKYAAIADEVRAKLRYSPVIVGFDAQKVQATTKALSKYQGLSGHFDVVSSHNAVNDQGATLEDWATLRRTAGKAVWASENPRPWHVLNARMQEVGVKAAVDASVEGLVLYLAFPSSVDARGELTPKGEGIARGIRATRCPTL
jgi:hypothetical protein